MIKHIATGIMNGKISSTILMCSLEEMFCAFLPLSITYLYTPLDLDLQIVWEYNNKAIEGVMSSERTLVFDTINVLSPCQSILLKLEIERLLNTKNK